MIQLTKNINNESEINEISTDIVQLSHIKGKSIYITDPEGNRLEIKKTDDGAKIVFTRDEIGKSLAIEERKNGTKIYHVSSDSTGLPSSHEIRPDQTEIIYFYNAKGTLQHFVELKTNGDRVSTLMGPTGSIYSIEQKQIGGIVFKAWLYESSEHKEGMIWLHPDGEISTYGNEGVISELFKKFSKFLDGVPVEAR